MGEQKVLGSVEGDSNCFGYDEIRGGMDSATRGTCHKWK